MEALEERRVSSLGGSEPRLLRCPSRRTPTTPTELYPLDLASNRNENQEYFLKGKGGRCVGLTTFPPSCADWLEIWEPQPAGTLRTCPGPYRDCCSFYSFKNNRRWTTTKNQVCLILRVIYWRQNTCSCIHASSMTKWPITSTVRNIPGRIYSYLTHVTYFLLSPNMKVHIRVIKFRHLT
jgi:hypothetical protein